MARRKTRRRKVESEVSVSVRVARGEAEQLGIDSPHCLDGVTMASTIFRPRARLRHKNLLERAPRRIVPVKELTANHREAFLKP